MTRGAPADDLSFSYVGLTSYLFLASNKNRTVVISLGTDRDFASRETRELKRQYPFMRIQIEELHSIGTSEEIKPENISSTPGRYVIRAKKDDKEQEAHYLTNRIRAAETYNKLCSSYPSQSIDVRKVQSKIEKRLFTLHGPQNEIYAGIQEAD